MNRAGKPARLATGLPNVHVGQLMCNVALPKEVVMGLIELLLIVLVIAAVAGGVGVSPLLWLLLVVALVLFLTGGGFGYRRGGRI